MTERTYWESVKAEGGAILDRVKEIIHEGNVRRVRVRQGDRTIAEFPLSAGIVGALLAPALAAIGAIVALAKDCTIDVEREVGAAEPANKSTPAA
jgi:soluble P-type ATPase